MIRSLRFAPAALVLVLAACGSSSSSSTSTTSSSSTAPASSDTTSSTAAATGHAMVALDPTHGKVGTVVKVTGSGYGPNVSVTGTLCTIDATGQIANPLTQCDVVDTVPATTDSTGAFTATFTVKRIPTPAQSGGYTIGFGVQGDAANSAGAPFTIDQ